MIISTCPVSMDVTKLKTPTLKSAIVGLSVSCAQWQTREDCERKLGTAWLIDCIWVLNGILLGSIVDVIKRQMLWSRPSALH